MHKEKNTREQREKFTNDLLDKIENDIAALDNENAKLVYKAVKLDIKEQIVKVIVILAIIIMLFLGERALIKAHINLPVTIACIIAALVLQIYALKWLRRFKKRWLMNSYFLAAIKKYKDYPPEG